MKNKSINLLVDSSKYYLLTVSSGIDSMVLAHLFLQQKICFAVAHCNFKLRDNEAELDQQLVEDLCEKHNITCHVTHFNTKEFAEENKLSIQEAARNLRYAFFEDLRIKHDFDFIVTAHHQDDNIETLLFHLFRGTGIKGLTGIPQQNKCIIRPLLSIPKQEIIDYAKSHNIAYRDDSSNVKNDYARNKIRNIILPIIEEAFPNTKQNMASTIHRLQDANELYTQSISHTSKKLIEQRGNDFFIPILKLFQSTPLQTITYELLKPFHFSYDQSAEVLKMKDSESGTYIQNELYRIIKNRNAFIITTLNKEESEHILINEDDSAITFADFNLTLKKIVPNKVTQNNDKMLEYIDAKKLHFPLLLRKWKQGDYMYPLGMNKKKKVSRILIDAKLSLHEKEKIWVLESDKKIAWLIGIKIDERFKLHSSTSQVIQLNCSKI